MMTIKNLNKGFTRTKLFYVLLPIMLTSSCSALTGTKVWCEYMEEKPKGDWSINEATEYAKHCVFDD